MKNLHEEIAREEEKQNMLEKIESSTSECQERRKMITGTRGSLQVNGD